MTVRGFDTDLGLRVLIAILVALSALPACGEEAPPPKEAATTSGRAATESAVLPADIAQLVQGLEYPDQVAQDLVLMTNGWKDYQGKPILDALRDKLSQARRDYKQARLPRAQLAEVEQTIAAGLIQRIKFEISFDSEFFDLADVVEHKQAQCLGYAQLICVTGSFLGLSVQAIDVTELMSGALPVGSGHVANMVSLTDGRTIMVDLALGLTSRPFIVDDAFADVGNCRELKNKANPLGIHRRIQPLDRNGLVGAIYSNRGAAYGKSAQFSQAVSEYAKAIAHNPQYATAYQNRGAAYIELRQHAQAISDCAKAIELDPKNAAAYNNRGVAYSDSGQLPRAISDFTKAIELNPRFALAYSNRGDAYGKSGQQPQAVSDHTKARELISELEKACYDRGNLHMCVPGELPQAISEFTKVVELNPNHADAYLGRGVAYAGLGRLAEGKRDLLKAVELNPALESRVRGASDYYKLDLRLDGSLPPSSSPDSGTALPDATSK